MFTRFVFIALAIVAALAAPHPACAWNVVNNADFRSNASGWVLSSTLNGAASSESYFGSPEGGSLRLQSYDNNDTSHAEQCVGVSKWLVVDFSLHKFNSGEYGTGTHSFKLDIFDAAACGGNKLTTITLPDAGVAMDGNPATGWVEVSVPGTPLPSGAISAKVNFDVVAGTSGVSYYLIDHVQVVPPDEIFPDAFEAP